VRSIHQAATVKGKRGGKAILCEKLQPFNVIIFKCAHYVKIASRK